MTVQATFAATLVDEWVRAGIRHAVLAPGSRSTPLALALAADGRVDLHVHHDERSAAFTAVGIGVATGIPAVVVTTSGTAAVELHPAVVEAHQGRVPLIAATADRPPELQHVGAPQTVDQTRLFGHAVRWYAQPGVPDVATRGTWRSLAARCVAEAAGPPRGPVHVDLAFRDPLVGEPDDLPPGRPDGEPWHRAVRSRRRLDDGEVARLGEALSAARGVIVAGRGSGPGASVARLSAATGWPVLADPRSESRVPGPGTVAAFDALLRHEGFAGEHRPDVVLRLGEPPASKVLAGWLASSGAVQVLVDADGAWFDPDRTAALVVAADPGSTCDRLASAWGGARDPAWQRSWAEAEAAAQNALTDLLDAGCEPSEPGVARRLVSALPPGQALVVSSSMPVRDVEWYGPPRDGLRVLANRGANGIDGVLSTAVGVALGSGAPTVVLLGDVAFLHDSNALLGLASRAGADLAAVVVDNRGGGIFSFLPQAREVDDARFELLFGTPHDVDLAALAAVHGVPATTVADLDELTPAVAAHAGQPRVVVVRTSDRAANVARHDELHAAVHAALDAR